MNILKNIWKRLLSLEVFCNYALVRYSFRQWLVELTKHEFLCFGGSSGVRAILVSNNHWAIEMTQGSRSLEILPSATRVDVAIMDELASALERLMLNQKWHFELLWKHSISTAIETALSSSFKRWQWMIKNCCTTWQPYTCKMLQDKIWELFQPGFSVQNILLQI